MMNNKLLPIGLVILAVGLAYFYIYPTYTDTITPAQQEISTYDTALTAATQFSQNEKTLLAQSQAISPSDLARLQWYMPDNVDQIHFIDSLNHLGSSYGVALSGFTIALGANNVSAASSTSTTASAGATSSTASSTAPAGAPVPASPNASGATNSLDITVSATATYSAFQAFLLALEQSAPLLDVTHLSVTSSDTGVYTYSLTIRTYWLQ